LQLYIAAAHFTINDEKSELVAISCVCEEQQRVNGNVKLAELCLKAEPKIVLNYPVKRPNKAQCVFTFTPSVSERSERSSSGRAMPRPPVTALPRLLIQHFTHLAAEVADAIGLLN
jgi:hypothetical protein